MRKIGDCKIEVEPEKKLFKHFLKLVWGFFFSFSPLHTALCQTPTLIKGIVLEESVKGKFNPLPGANVFWLNTTKGTTTDTSGFFQIEKDSLSNKLIVSFIGYENDTLKDFSSARLRIVLGVEKSRKLQEVIIEQSRQSSFMDLLSPTNTKIMTSKELRKAACCNLSESFETNAGIDVNFTDAVTGTKQIQMLGLSGIYAPLSIENIPNLRVLSAHTGLTFIPGPWVESIQVTRGIGSIVNGFESITGSINVELKKPELTMKDKYRLHLNSYVNSMGRTEINADYISVLNKKWSFQTFFHSNFMDRENDMNKDGFLDIPKGRQFNLAQRWKFKTESGWIVQFGFQALADHRLGGQTIKSALNNTDLKYRYDVWQNNLKADFWIKAGYVFPNSKYRSIGWISNATTSQVDFWTGSSYYTGHQNSIHSNLIFQDIIGNTNHTYRAGFSLIQDKINDLQSKIGQELESEFQRKDFFKGFYGEYSFTGIPRLVLLLGLRADHHNFFGWMPTSRLHAKYELDDKTYVRFGMGNGFRISNIFSENQSFFISRRTFEIEATQNYGYGLKPEKGWNYGMSFNKTTSIFQKPLTLTLDYHFTHFQNQSVVDLYSSRSKILFYDLNGRSYSHSFLAEAEIQPAKGFIARLDYRFLNVMTNFSGNERMRPYVAPHRLFLNLEYTTFKRWSYDLTLNWFSSKMLPAGLQADVNSNQIFHSPAYFLANAQVSKRWNKLLETYVGLENIFDYRQTKLIVNPQAPFSPGFDAALVWGPVVGRMLYFGFRLALLPGK